MDRRPTLRTSRRSSTVPHPPSAAWAVVASAEDRPQWYVDATPWVVRGGIDRALGGEGRRWPAPGRPRLRAGDRAGFWEVEQVEDDARRLRMRAAVRAPGQVLLDVAVDAEGTGASRVTTDISFLPDGLLGRAYLLTDLPAREVVTELAHRRLVADVRRGTR